MTGRDDILWRIIEKIAKKLKMKSQEQKNSFSVNLSENFPQIYYFGSCYFNFIFFSVFSKMRQLDYIDPYENFCSSNFKNSYFSSIVEKLNTMNYQKKKQFLIYTNRGIVPL